MSLPRTVVLGALALLSSRSVATAEPSLDLGFEAPALGGWTHRESADFDASLVTDRCPEGRQCLRIRVRDGLGAVRGLLDARPSRGKRLRVSFAVRTEGVDGFAGVFLRAQSGKKILANESSRDLGIRGTRPLGPA